MIMYGQTIKDADGEVSISGCPSAEAATSKAVSMAISSGWRPPRWYEFGRPSWSKACRAEYDRQTGPAK